MKALRIVVALLLLSSLAYAQHSVSLSWGASTTTGVTYTVNRGTASGAETSYKTGITTTTYTDTAVTAGATYFYNVVAVCGSSCPAGTSGTSTPTNEIQAVIPNNLPSPPGPLTVSQIAENPPALQPTWALSTLPNVTRQYVLRQQPDGNKVWVSQKQLKPSITSYQDSNVKKGKTYGYEVEACSKTQCLTSAAVFATVE